VNKGTVFETFTDRDHAIPGNVAPGTPGAPNTVANSSSAHASATVAITSPVQGAEIEVDGAFVGSTPTTLSLTAGPHQISVKNGVDVWQRTMQVNAGSSVTVNAQLSNSQMTARRSH
jgi:hypothetical protein